MVEFQAQQRRQPDYLINVSLIGDSGVGKTSLMRRFADKKFTASTFSTIGIDYCFRTLQIDGKIAKVQLRGTAGQERFMPTPTSFYRSMDGVILVYDITERETFDNLHVWLKDIFRLAPKSCRKMIVGNKKDLEKDRIVTLAEAKYYANELGLSIVEASAKSSDHVDELFLAIIREVVREVKKNNENYGLPLTLNLEAPAIKLESDNRNSDGFRSRCYCRN